MEEPMMIIRAGKQYKKQVARILKSNVECPKMIEYMKKYSIRQKIIPKVSSVLQEIILTQGKVINDTGVEVDENRYNKKQTSHALSNKDV